MIKINNKKFETTNFPNGESLLDFKDFNISWNNKIEVSLHFENDSDLICLMFIKKHLDRHFPNKNILLILKYMPYSRMDRPINKFAFTLKYVCELINDLMFDEVYVHEPHSYTTIALLDNCSYGLTSLLVVKKAMNEIEFDKEKDYILFPDSGASKKYEEHFLGYKTITGFKRRELQTGKIESFEVMCDDDLNGSNVVICDDLCSRGGTFLATANALQEKNVGDIYLAVTHLENNVLTGNLPNSELIKGIYATNSIYTEKVFDKLTIVEV